MPKLSQSKSIQIDNGKDANLKLKKGKGKKAYLETEFEVLDDVPDLTDIGKIRVKTRYAVIENGTPNVYNVDACRMVSPQRYRNMEMFTENPQGIRTQAATWAGNGFWPVKRHPETNLQEEVDGMNSLRDTGFARGFFVHGDDLTNARHKPHHEAHAIRKKQHKYNDGPAWMNQRFFTSFNPVVNKNTAVYLPTNYNMFGRNNRLNSMKEVADFTNGKVREIEPMLPSDSYRAGIEDDVDAPPHTLQSLHSMSLLSQH